MRKLLLILLLISSSVYSQDLVKYFNLFYKDGLKLTNVNGNWDLSTLNNYDKDYKAKLEIIDLKNYYLKFLNEFIGKDAGPVAGSYYTTFALYLRKNKSPIAALYGGSYSFGGFYELSGNKWVSVEDKIFPNNLSKNLYWLFFDEKINLSKLNENSGGRNYDINKRPPNTQPFIEEEDMTTYVWDIPRIGTETKLLLHISDRYKDLVMEKGFPADIIYLVNNVKYKEITFGWDYKQGIFRIKSKK